MRASRVADARHRDVEVPDAELRSAFRTSPEAAFRANATSRRAVLRAAFAAGSTAAFRAETPSPAVLRSADTAGLFRMLGFRHATYSRSRMIPSTSTGRAEKLTSEFVTSADPDRPCDDPEKLQVTCMGCRQQIRRSGGGLKTLKQEVLP